MTPKARVQTTDTDKTTTHLAHWSEIHRRLKENGSRVTAQREYILDVFFQHSKGRHLSVEDIHRLIQKHYDANVSLATIYRTVKTLYALGILREIDLAEDHKHYELALPNQHHHHIVCLNCNHTIEFDSEEINQLAREIAKKYNIEVKDVELKIVGNCLDTHEGTGHHDEEFPSNHRR